MNFTLTLLTINTFQYRFDNEHAAMRAVNNVRQPHIYALRTMRLCGHSQGAVPVARGRRDL